MQKCQDQINLFFVDVEELAEAVPFGKELTIICRHTTRLAVRPIRVRMELRALIFKIPTIARVHLDTKAQTAKLHIKLTFVVPLMVLIYTTVPRTLTAMIM